MKIFNKKSEEEKVEEEIISMVNEGNEQGLIEDSEAQFITNIFEFTHQGAGAPQAAHNPPSHTTSIRVKTNRG